MLQIVSQTSCFVRVVLTTCSHSYVSLDSWAVLIHAQIDLQSVVECVDTSLQRVTLITLVLIVLLCADTQHHRQKS